DGLRLQHRHRRGDGADQRDLPAARLGAARRRALRGRHGGLADLPVRTAPRLGGLRDDDRPTRVGGALAGGRPGAARARRDPARGPGEREAGRPAARAVNGHPGGARGARTRLRQAGGAFGRRPNRQDCGRARKTRELRGALSVDSRETLLPVGPLIAAIGAILLIVSLFLDWYDGLTGFTVFEFIDLLLMGLALATLFALAAAMGAVRTPLRPGLLLGVGLLALVIVLSQVVN